VSVFVIDWTTTGAADPTCTPSIQVLTVGRRFDWEGEGAKVSVSIYDAERYAAAGDRRMTDGAGRLTTVSSTTTFAVA